MTTNKQMLINYSLWLLLLCSFTYSVNSAEQIYTHNPDSTLLCCCYSTIYDVLRRLEWEYKLHLLNTERISFPMGGKHSRRKHHHHHTHQQFNNSTVTKYCLLFDLNNFLFNFTLSVFSIVCGGDCFVKCSTVNRLNEIHY